MGTEAVTLLMNELRQTAPATVGAAEKVLPINMVQGVLETLVQEGVSIRDLSTILDHVVKDSAVDKDIVRLAESTRVSVLKHAISHRLTAGTRQLEVIRVDPLVEDVIERGHQRRGTSITFTMPPEMFRDIKASFARAIDEARAKLAARGDAPTKPVLIWTDLKVRRPTFVLLAGDHPDIRVTCPNELTSDVAVQPPLATVGPPGGRAPLTGGA
jgi:flagellar biosynthesis protein FlhA